MANYASDYDADKVNEQSVSDSESCACDGSNKDSKFIEGLFDGDLIRLNKDEAIFDVIGHQFMSNLRGFEQSSSNFNAVIEAIHKMNWSKSVITQARLQCFNIYRHALLQFDGDEYSDCIEYVWYFDSKQGIQSIVSNGFSYRQLDPYHGIRVFPINCLAQRVQACVDDDDGLKHVLLCQVLMKNKERPRELNSEVDEVISPSQYVVCSTKMNTHILPEYVISFRIFPCLDRIPKARLSWRKPTPSPRLPFSKLIPIIFRSLPPNTVKLIIKNYIEFKEGKISRQDWIRRLRRFAGDDLLIKAIKSYGTNN